MGKLRGFLEIQRQKPASQPTNDRLRHWREFELPMVTSAIRAVRV